MEPHLLIGLVERYFNAVDRMDVTATLACFVPDATFTIATFDTTYRGRDGEVRGMYERLNTRYAKVWHGDFDHVVMAPSRIASRFRVENTLHAGSLQVKHNCNFFRVREAAGVWLFDEVFVYMSGANSLG